MGTYPCSNCGSTADTAKGCPSCGHTLEAELSALNATIFAMQQRSVTMKEDRAALMGRLQGAIAIRSVLERAAGRHDGTVQTPKLARILPVPGKSRPMDMPVKTGRRVRAEPAAPPSAPTVRKPPGGTPTAAPTIGTPRPPRPPGTRPPMTQAATPAHPPPHPPETSRRSTQNIVLGIGAVVMAIAVILTPFFYGNSGALTRGVVLAILTIVAIAAPIALIRFELVTTSEWISPLGLLLILLDGQEIWVAQVRHTGLSGSTYAGLVMIVATFVAAGYQRVTGLAVPRFATTLLIQPIPVLLLFPWLTDLTAWASVLAMLAAVDLVIVLRIHRAGRHGRNLRLAVRTLQEVVNGAAIVVGGIGLARTHGATESIRAGAPVVAAAVIALAAGLLYRNRPLPDISAGIATLAAIGGFARMGALLLPGWGLTAAAVAIAGCSIGVYLLPKYARTGAQIAGGTAAIVTAVLVVLRGWSALRTPIAAALPAWHADLTTYAATVGRDAGVHTGQLVTAVLLLAIAAAVMLPTTWRRDSIVIGVAVATILAPGAWRLPWALAIVIGLVVALLIGAYTLTAKNKRESWIGIVAAFVVGGYTAGIAVARPGGQALFLGALTLGAAAIASGGAAVARSNGITPDRRTGEASWGAAAFALPGAVAALTALPAPHGAIVGEAVIASAFVAVAGALTVAAIAQVAMRRPVPLLVGGATGGALVTAIAAGRTGGLNQADTVVAFLLFASSLLLLFAPILNTGFGSLGFGGWRLADLDGEELAAAAVTCASIVALARVAALVVPDASLVIVAALVTVIAAGTRSLQESWRRGPVIGGAMVGVVITLTGAYAAFDVAITAIRLNRPVWHAPLAGWAQRLASHTNSLAHGWQAVAALILIAIAARIVLPARASAVAVAVTLGLTALLLPETLHTGWWGPLACSGIGATIAGLAAAYSRDMVVALGRAGVATLLFANTIAASLVQAGTTATTLIGSAVVCVAVSVLAVRTMRAVRAEDTTVSTAFLGVIGGGALAGAILTLTGGSAIAAAATGQSLTSVLAVGMLGLTVALGFVVLNAARLEPLLGHASAAVSVGGLGLALASAAHFTTAGVFAAFAAVLAVLAEVTRAAVARTHESEPGYVARAPRRSDVGIGAGWFPQRTEVLLVAGPATALAVASVAGSVVAAVVGPYHWLGMIWRGAPHTFHEQLGVFTPWVGAPAGIATAVLLTVMATIGAVGFGGDRSAVTARAVAVVTPGIAICLLIAPYLVRAPWPIGALAALLVATISGLAVTLTDPPDDTDDASPLRFARRFVLFTCVFASGAGLAGSLPTKPMTITALAIATAAGLVAAFHSREQIGRITGWIVTATAAELLALVASLSAGMPRYDAAFVVGAVAGALLIVAARVPRMSLSEFENENRTVEISAYAGAVLGLVLASSSIPHLAVFLGAWGAVLGIATARSQRTATYRSALMWTAALHELAAWVLLMTYTRVSAPEKYTLGIAVIALVTGWIERRWHPELTSWVTYGIALAAALGPSLVIVIATNGTTLRIVLLLLGSTAVLLWGSIRRQQAPTIIGAVALLGATINLVARYSTTILVLVLLVLIAGILIGVGATFEKQRNKLWSAFNKMQ